MLIASKRLISVNKEQAVCSELNSASYVIGSFNYRKVVAYADLADGVSLSNLQKDVCGN